MVLQVDVAGIPQKWMQPLDAATLFCGNDIAWSLPPTITVLRGGYQKTGQRSILEIPAIIATRGHAEINLLDIEPRLTKHNEKLFSRDRCICAYCGEKFPEELLTREHILPLSFGGRDHWNNVVSACSPCNGAKKNRTPEQARMPLLYLPYTPNRYEDFLLARGGKTILADQMDFLLSKVHSGSRLL